MPELAIAMYDILQGGGLTTGGMNFDAKLRRQSLDAEGLIAAHVGGMDVLARSLLTAAKMIEEGSFAAFTEQRYAGWQSAQAQAMLGGDLSLDAIADKAEVSNLDPQPKSGKQEMLENLVNRFV